MLYCACCGCELSGDSPGEAGSLCIECRHAMDTGVDLSPRPAKAVAQASSGSSRFTLTIVILNFAVFAAMGFRVHGLTDGQLVVWGASWGPLSLGGQWWRIISSMFVHYGLVHLFANMGTLWVMGKMAERLIGKWSFVLLYLISGMAGTVLSLAVTPEALTAGASGAVFGVMGALLAAFVRGRLQGSATRLKVSFWLLLAFTAYSLYDGWTDPHINNAAHVGGLLSGLIIGAVLTRNVAESTRLRLRFFAVVTMVLITAMLAVRHQHRWMARLGSAAEAISEDRLKDATANLSIVLREHPNDVLANVIMGDVYIRQGNYSQAEISLKRGLMTGHRSNSAERLLGLVYLKTGRFDEALDCATSLIDHGDMDVDVQTLFADALEGKGDHALAGGAYLRLRRYDDAIASFEKALKQKPDDEASKRGLAEAYRAKGMND